MAFKAWRGYEMTEICRMSLVGSKSWLHGDRQMCLLPEKAVWWPAQSTLIVSDLHLSKAEHFRSKGLSVPPTVDLQTLSTLTMLIRELRPRALVMLGDLFHSAPNRAWSDFQNWLKEEVDAGLKQAILVRGNHDRAEDSTYNAMGLEVVDAWEHDQVVLSHEPNDELPKGTAVHLCGHIHPAVRMRGSGRQTLRLPCFVQTSTGCEGGFRLIIPAFGAFTGTHLVEPKRGSEVFVVADSKVVGPFRSEPQRAVNPRGRT